MHNETNTNHENDGKQLPLKFARIRGFKLPPFKSLHVLTLQTLYITLKLWIIYCAVAVDEYSVYELAGISTPGQKYDIVGTCVQGVLDSCMASLTTKGHNEMLFKCISEIY